ncbi:hypothetical protein F511_44134 [Dorcoceras hygrometricum]|uniref:Uncharacterized protein n=1 Tax=Dorcoceras hygrometricum TaxID=472368 RepID=A0A2Z7C879_9LAMI|nr:hypothetical protein F511_44134 [Dorcoceras hygrometricum]
MNSAVAQRQKKSAVAIKISAEDQQKLTVVEERQKLITDVDQVQALSISPGTANLKPSLTGHGNSAAKQLKHNFKTEEKTYPKANTNGGTLGQDFTESVERTGSSRFLKSTVPVSKLVSIGRETQEEFSATNIIQNNGGTRRQSTKEYYGAQ